MKWLLRIFMVLFTLIAVGLSVFATVYAFFISAVSPDLYKCCCLALCWGGTFMAVSSLVRVFRL